MKRAIALDPSLAEPHATFVPFTARSRMSGVDLDSSKHGKRRILNAAPHLQIAFLTGYNLGDGLRAGHGIDTFKSFRTASPTLAAGLVSVSGWSSGCAPHRLVLSDRSTSTGLRPGSYRSSVR